MKSHWNLAGKRQALVRLGDEVWKKYNLCDPFEKYEKEVDELTSDVSKISQQINAIQDGLSERLRSDTISKTDKEAKTGLVIKTTKNWATAYDKVRKYGPEKKKPGRKRKNEEEISFESAKALKHQLGSVSKRNVGKLVEIHARKKKIGVGKLKSVDGQVCRIEVKRKNSAMFDFSSDMFDPDLEEVLATESSAVISIFKKNCKLSSIIHCESDEESYVDSDNDNGEGAFIDSSTMVEDTETDTHSRLDDDSDTHFRLDDDSDTHFRPDDDCSNHDTHIDVERIRIFVSSLKQEQILTRMLHVSGMMLTVVLK